MYQYTDNCPVYAPLFSVLGCATATILCCLGASYGTAKSGVGAMVMGILRPEMMVKGIMPCVLSGIVGIYGLVLSVLISSFVRAPMSSFEGFTHFGAGLAVGMGGLASGFSIGIVGDAGVRGCVQQPKLFVGMILILIFAEVLGLYGLIVGLLLVSKGQQGAGGC